MTATTTEHPAPVLRITGFDIPFPSPKLEEFHLPTPDRVLAALDTWEWDD